MTLEREAQEDWRENARQRQEIEQMQKQHQEELACLQAQLYAMHVQHRVQVAGLSQQEVETLQDRLN